MDWVVGRLLPLCPLTGCTWTFGSDDQIPTADQKLYGKNWRFGYKLEFFSIEYLRYSIKIKRGAWSRQFFHDACQLAWLYGRDTNGSIFMEVADKRLDMTDLPKDATTEEIKEASIENPDGRYFSLHTGFQRLILQKWSQKWSKKGSFRWVKYNFTKIRARRTSFSASYLIFFLF